MPVKHWILSIADDLTGALEAGAQFAQCGLRSRVQTTFGGRPTDVPVLVIDTETRHMSPSKAYAVVRDTAASGAQEAPWLIYKKVDSTLRGNIREEFRALLDVYSNQSITYVPAYPRMGRTVRDGRLYVRGVPVHIGAFAADSLNPVRQSDIPALLTGLPVEVLDGTSDADVLAAANRIAAELPPSIAAGPAALAGALAKCVPLPRSSMPPCPRLSRCLVVNGSLHPASVDQVSFAKSRGCLNSPWRILDDDPGLAGLERAHWIGERVRRELTACATDALVVFGGDTAFGIHQAIGADPFEPLAEVVPGVPLSRCGDLYWITKAGGFGEADVLCEIRRRLT
jgi:uncharacterized protein YgbK (DUF1537 family)